MTRGSAYRPLVALYERARAREFDGTRLRLRRMTRPAIGEVIWKLTKKYECDDPSARPIVTSYLTEAEYRVLRALPIVEPIVDKIFGYMPYTALFNASGNPAMSVPLHWNAAGLPIGMQFVARFGDEATLFRLAGQLERARPWFDKAPPGF